MTWPELYLVSFLVGLVLCVLAFASGAGHLHLGHVHLGHLHSGHGQVGRVPAPHAGHGANPTMSSINGFTITVFLCWFGGIGYLLTQRHAFAALAVLLIAAVTGLAGAAVVSLFLTRVLLPHERALLPEDTEMRGVVARVSAAVRPHGTGEILFSLNGTRRSAAARTEDGSALPRDAEVLVTRYARGVASVRRFSELDESGEETRTAHGAEASEAATGPPPT